MTLRERSGSARARDLRPARRPLSGPALQWRGAQLAEDARRIDRGRRAPAARCGHLERLVSGDRGGRRAYLGDHDLGAAHSAGCTASACGCSASGRPVAANPAHVVLGVPHRDADGRALPRGTLRGHSPRGRRERVSARQHDTLLRADSCVVLPQGQDELARDHRSAHGFRRRRADGREPARRDGRHWQLRARNGSGAAWSGGLGSRHVDREEADGARGRLRPGRLHRGPST